MNAATFQQLEKVMNNPSESGIDVEGSCLRIYFALFSILYRSCENQKAKMTCTLPWK